MKRRFLTLIAGGVTADAIAFIKAVLADGGFVVAKSHIRKVFKQQKQADLICPMAGGKVGKLYFWINED